MGTTAENLHDRFPHLTKERADALRRRARQEKTAKALRRRQDPARPGAGRHPLAPSRAGAWPPPTSRRARGTTLEDLAALKTPFRPHGRVTAGNAAGLNDGATACLLAAEETAARARACRSRMRLVVVRLRRASSPR